MMRLMRIVWAMVWHVISRAPVGPRAGGGVLSLSFPLCIYYIILYYIILYYIAGWGGALALLPSPCPPLSLPRARSLCPCLRLCLSLPPSPTLSLARSPFLAPSHSTALPHSAKRERERLGRSLPLPVLPALPLTSRPPVCRTRAE